MKVTNIIYNYISKLKNKLFHLALIQGGSLFSKIKKKIWGHFYDRKKVSLVTFYTVLLHKKRVFQKIYIFL